MQHDDMPTPEPSAPTATAAASPTSGDSFDIAMLDNRFDPADTTISLGTTVTWTNKGRNWHSVASFDGSFESGKLGPGEQFSHQFTGAGTVQYICKHHGLQGMIGSITVTG
jgi:plastocyanin